jgi:adhesin/invasin
VRRRGEHVRCRLVIFVALVVTAVAVIGAGLSAASFTTASSTAIQASTSQLISDTLSVNGGDNQSAAVGTAVATAPSVLVTDTNNNPVSGVSVTFAVASGGGSATGTSATTNASGIATVGSWTLGTGAGANTLRASSPGLNGSPVTFTATGSPGAGSKYLVTASSYSPVVGSAVTVAAQLADAYGNLVKTAGLSVTWSKTGTGGSFGANPTSTDANGVARVVFTTSATPGTAYAVTAISSGASGTSPVFTSVVGPAATIALNAGNNQTATVGTAVTTAPSVLVSDAYNNPVSGVSVTFAVASGGGSVTGASATTNASGIATVGSWMLGTTAGANTLTATSAGLTGSPVTFTATGVAGAATKYVVTSSSYNPAAGTSVTITAQTCDAYGNAVPVSGISVSWSKTGSGGSFGTNPAVTDASGVATTTFTTGSTSGTVYAITATSTGRTGTSAAITTRTASRIALNAGDSQSARAGSAVAVAPSVLVTDASGNPVSGIVVTFSVYSGGGSITGASATTSAAGIATVGSWTLGPSAGTNTLRATRSGLTGSPLTFTATGVAGPAAKIVLNAGNTQSATVNTAVATAPSVKVTDSNNNPVSGVAVTFAVASGGGSITGASATTSAAGIAAVGSWTVGTTAGSNTLTATSPGLSGSPVTFSATGVAGAASMYVVTASTYTPTAGTTVAITAQLADTYGNAVKTSGISVTFSKTGTGGSLSGTNPVSTNSNGIATINLVTGTTAGVTYTVTATSTGRTGTSPNIVTK